MDQHKDVIEIRGFLGKEHTVDYGNLPGVADVFTSCIMSPQREKIPVCVLVNRC
jgi:hypothetical protein